ncbi:hypothetical protein [Actinoallomurus soli]|uniref:hypothetical protein n=1 Tax=Actinoallomurus soli TaxID=2952535 RepID=UPI002093165F|nr:hypothetical protein [Actinoallomurus soli]MCO5969689.1 hypothetical protein [Actinoallomurus soli]
MIEVWLSALGDMAIDGLHDALHRAVVVPQALLGVDGHAQLEQQFLRAPVLVPLLDGLDADRAVFDGGGTAGRVTAARSENLAGVETTGCRDDEIRRRVAVADRRIGQRLSNSGRTT